MELEKIRVTELMINSKSGVITADFETFKLNLASVLEKFDLVVTEDGAKDAKKLSAELNKITAEIKKYAKKHIDEVEKPIMIFREQVKELVGLVQEKRENLVRQINVFEAERKKLALKMVTDFLNNEYSLNGIEEQYQDIDVSNYGKLTTLTKADNLTSAVKNEITSLVLEKKVIQQNVAIRLASLEGKSLAYGLKTSLTESDVRGFILEDDDVYDQNLNLKLEAELLRQQKIEEKNRLEAERQLEIEKQLIEKQARAEVERKIQAEKEKNRLELEAKLKAEKERNRLELEAKLKAEKEKNRLELEAKLKAESVLEEKERLVKKNNSAEQLIKQESVEQEGNIQSNKNRFIVKAEFSGTVGKNITAELIEKNFRKKMVSAGVSNLSAVTVTVF